jgi:hypothetical protein
MVEELIDLYAEYPDDHKDYIYMRVNFDFVMDRLYAEELQYMYEFAKVNSDAIDNIDTREGFIAMFENYLSQRDMLIYEANQVAGHFIYTFRKLITKPKNRFIDTDKVDIDDSLKYMKLRNEPPYRRNQNIVATSSDGIKFYGIFTADRQFKVADVGAQKNEKTRKGVSSEKNFQTGQNCASREVPQLAGYLKILENIKEVQESMYINDIKKNYASRSQMCALIEKILRFLDSNRYIIEDHKYTYKHTRRWIIYPYEK